MLATNLSKTLQYGRVRLLMAKRYFPAIILLIVLFQSVSCNQHKKNDKLPIFAAAYYLSQKGGSNACEASYEAPSCYPDTASDGNLVISEIGDCSVSYTSCWFEVFNRSRSSINLSDYKLRTTAYNATTFNLAATVTFDLPTKTIESGKFHVLRMKVSTTDYDGTELTHITYTSFIPTWWLGRGFIELLDKNNSTVDFVRFGTNTENPTSSSFSYSTNAPSLSTTVATNPGMTIARDCKLTNTKSGADWFSRTFPTPAAANDVTCTIDADEDGIPDCAEVNESQSYAGWNYYRMGARTNQKDIFVEVDYAGGPEISKNSIKKIQDLMKDKGYFLQADMGKSCNNPGNFELGTGGDKYETSVTTTLDATSSKAISLREIKAKNFRLSRLPVFHYAISSFTSTCCNSGVGELFGNDFIVFDITSSNFTTFMHELGHNLGLHHGGFESTNYKPNYVSIMNYLYTLYGGFPKIGASNEGAPYYNFLKSKNINQGSTNCYSNSSYNLDTSFNFSDGVSADIDENSIFETKGIGRSNSVPVDFNCNGITDSTPFSLNLNPGDGSDDSDSVKTILKDNNDWANLKLSFRNYYSGFRNTSPTDQRQIPVHSYINNDKQEIVDDRGMPVISK